MKTLSLFFRKFLICLFIVHPLFHSRNLDLLKLDRLAFQELSCYHKIRFVFVWSIHYNYLNVKILKTLATIHHFTWSKSERQNCLATSLFVQTVCNRFTQCCYFFVYTFYLTNNAMQLLFFPTCLWMNFAEKNTVLNRFLIAKASYCRNDRLMTLFSFWQPQTNQLTYK